MSNNANINSEIIIANLEKSNTANTISNLASSAPSTRGDYRCVSFRSGCFLA